MAKPSKQAVFWRKVYRFRDKDGNRLAKPEAVLEPLPAVVVGASKPVCHICHEPEEGHARPNRKHVFTMPPDPGMTIDVTYLDGRVERRSNVRFGREANCWWTEKE